MLLVQSGKIWKFQHHWEKKNLIEWNWKIINILAIIHIDKLTMWSIGQNVDIFVFVFSHLWLDLNWIELNSNNNHHHHHHYLDFQQIRVSLLFEWYTSHSIDQNIAINQSIKRQMLIINLFSFFSVNETNLTLKLLSSIFASI